MSDFQKEYYYRIVQAIIAIVLAGVKDYIFWLAPRALSYCNRASFTYSLCFGEPRKKNTGEKTRRQQESCPMHAQWLGSNNGSQADSNSSLKCKSSLELIENQLLNTKHLASRFVQLRDDPMSITRQNSRRFS